MPLEPISDVNPGDMILVHGTTWLGALIRFFLRMRFRCTEERRFAHWSHAALVVGPKGQIVEVLARGVVLRELRRYKDDDCLHISVDLSAADRSKAVGFAVARLRQRYGALGFLLLTFALLFRDRFRVGDFGQQGCAVLIARALQQAGMSFERRPVEMTPADLAKHFHAVPDEGSATDVASRSPAA
jgi:hypothetical protein